MGKQRRFPPLFFCAPYRAAGSEQPARTNPDSKISSPSPEPGQETTRDPIFILVLKRYYWRHSRGCWRSAFDQRTALVGNSSQPKYLLARMSRKNHCVASYLFQNGETLNDCNLILLIALCLSFPALAKEAVVAEAGLSFSMAEDWFHEIETTTTGTGRLVQHWVHKPLSYQGQRYMPEITAWTVPLKDDSELVDLTKDTLSRAPFETTIEAVGCLKCVPALLPRQGSIWLSRVGPTKAFTAAISHKDWPDCELGNVADYHGSCIFKRINSVGLSIEPSLVFRFQKDVESKTVDVIVISLIIDQRLVVIAFWYPLAMREQLADEIFSIIRSFRLRNESRIG